MTSDEDQDEDGHRPDDSSDPDSDPDSGHAGGEGHSASPRPPWRDRVEMVRRIRAAREDVDEALTNLEETIEAGEAVTEKDLARLDRALVAVESLQLARYLDQSTSRDGPGEDDSEV